MLRSSLMVLMVLSGVAGSVRNAGFAQPVAESLPLVRIEGDLSVDPALVRDVQTTLERDGDQTFLRMVTGHAAKWPGITFQPPGESWDLSGFAEIAVRVENVDSAPVTVNCRVDSPGRDGETSSLTGHVTLEPGQTETLRVPLTRRVPDALADKLYGMRGYPGGTREQGLDPSRITQLIVFVNVPQREHAFRLQTIVARGASQPEDWSAMDPETFFPMIDRFGQFRHKSWPGKTKSEEDMRRTASVESQSLDEHPGPEEWTEYGGWNRGPERAATGFFYPAKHAGKWWLVDPTGHLFWSHGADCVGFSGGTTPISDREFYFQDLPAEDSSLGEFYGRGSWAPHGYYADKGAYRTFNFTGANLFRKYGEDWRAKATELVHRRLRSWSMNTIANWSDANIYLQRKTPYVVSAGSGGAKAIEGSSGYWGKFPDPFDPSFRAALDRRMGWERNRSSGDPWCIGYFVDNELAWGDELSLATASLASPREQAAKQAFLADLQKKYATIQRLNAAWSTDYASWESLAEQRTAPKESDARKDLEAFATRIAETYFRECRDAVKRVAPDNLYLGCRFAWVNDRVVQAAAKYCDVIGYNLYRDDVSDFRLPAGLDRPVIIGEFHFGALDRGMFHTGLRPTASQADRANAYRRYVTGALKNPCFVGTHWFQFGDQATTGRGDGENYQIGLVDICDRPYPETIQAVREVGSAMYLTRTAP